MKESFRSDISINVLGSILIFLFLIIFGLVYSKYLVGCLFILFIFLLAQFLITKGYSNSFVFGTDFLIILNLLKFKNNRIKYRYSDIVKIIINNKRTAFVETKIEIIFHQGDVKKYGFRGIHTYDLLRMKELLEKHQIEVRFIE